MGAGPGGPRYPGTVPTDDARRNTPRPAGVRRWRGASPARLCPNPSRPGSRSLRTAHGVGITACPRALAARTHGAHATTRQPRCGEPAARPAGRKEAYASGWASSAGCASETTARGHGQGQRVLRTPTSPLPAAIDERHRLQPPAITSGSVRAVSGHGSDGQSARRGRRRAGSRGWPRRRACALHVVRTAVRVRAPAQSLRAPRLPASSSGQSAHQSWPRLGTVSISLILHGDARTYYDMPTRHCRSGGDRHE